MAFIHHVNILQLQRKRQDLYNFVVNLRKGKSLGEPFLSEEELRRIASENDLSIPTTYLSKEETFCSHFFDHKNFKDLKNVLEQSLRGLSCLFLENFNIHVLFQNRVQDGETEGNSCWRRRRTFAILSSLRQLG